MQVDGEDVALNHPCQAVPVAVSRALDNGGQGLAAGPRTVPPRWVFKPVGGWVRPSTKGVDTTSPMVRSACGEVVTSSSPTPSTRSPAEVFRTSGPAPE